MSKRRFAPAGVRGDNWQGCMLMCVHALCVPTLCVLVCVPAQCVPALCVLMCVRVSARAVALQHAHFFLAVQRAAAAVMRNSTAAGCFAAWGHRVWVFRCVGA
jgi:hypothetical protein